MNCQATDTIDEDRAQAGRPAPGGPPLTVYWRPHCSSCMRVKEYLRQHGIVFRSVNVLEEPEALRRLAEHGIRSIPVVQRGDSEFVFAQFLEDVSRFLRLPPPAKSGLDAREMKDKLVELLSSTARYTRQLPEASVRKVVAGTQRPYGDFAFHVFRIVESFVDGARHAYLRDAMILATLPDSMRVAGDIADYGERVVAGFESWWQTEGLKEQWHRVIRTDYGDKPLWDTFERSSWHAAQHVRQVMSLWQSEGVVLDRPLAEAAFAGLPVPADVTDRL